MSLQKRVELARHLGVAPDDVDYDAIMRPIWRANYFYGYDNYTEQDLHDIMTDAERDAYAHVYHIAKKYGG